MSFLLHRHHSVNYKQVWSRMFLYVFINMMELTRKTLSTA